MREKEYNVVIRFIYKTKAKSKKEVIKTALIAKGKRTIEIEETDVSRLSRGNGNKKSPKLKK